MTRIWLLDRFRRIQYESGLFFRREPDIGC